MINELQPTNPNLPGSPHVSGKWIRKALLVNEKLLVAEDHTGEIGESHGKFTTTVAHHTLQAGCVPFFTQVPKEIHAVAHTNGGRQSPHDNFFVSDAPDYKVIVVHAGRGVVPTYNNPQTKHQQADFIWLRVQDLVAYGEGKWLNQFVNLSFKQAVKLASFKDRVDASEFESDFAALLDILFPGRVENRIAFRLLCDAYKFRKIDNQSKCGGIEIHAPEDIGQWLAPFGKEPGDNDAAKAKAIDDVASMIGSGDIKTKAKAVLETANFNDEKLRIAVKGFLEELAKPTA
jgi:hypothetical protein